MDTGQGPSLSIKSQTDGRSGGSDGDTIHTDTVKHSRHSLQRIESIKILIFDTIS